MARFLPLLTFAASSLFATVPVSFTSGSPAKADDVNRNFAALDSAIQKKADASAVSVLQTAVAAKADASALKGIPTSDSLAALRSTIGQKADGSMVTKTVSDTASLLRTKISAITPASIGALSPSSADGRYLIKTGDSLQLPKLAGTGSRIVVADERGTLKTGIDASAITTGGPYLPTSGGSLSGNLRIPDGDLYLRAPSDDINHGVGYYGGTKTWEGQDVDGPVVYGCTGGALGTIRNGERPQKIALMWNSSGSVTVFGRFTASGEANFAADTVGAVDPAFGVPYDAKFRKYGIATTELLVTGSASIHGNIVTKGIPASNVADYVFEPDYKLTPLSEVEAYTKEHKHLPEVPSATEIGKSGLDLAQMNLVLLKKVEELTLHAIAQQKAMEAQTKVEAVLRSELTELRTIVDGLKTR